MLEVFLRHAGQVLAREQLLSHVWGYDYDPGSNVVDVYVGYLRRKLGKERIVTVRGMGYALARRRRPGPPDAAQVVRGLSFAAHRPLTGPPGILIFLVVDYAGSNRQGN